MGQNSTFSWDRELLRKGPSSILFLYLLQKSAVVLVLETWISTP